MALVRRTSSSIVICSSLVRLPLYHTHTTQADVRPRVYIYLQATEQFLVTMNSTVGGKRVAFVCLLATCHSPRATNYYMFVITRERVSNRNISCGRDLPPNQPHGSRNTYQALQHWPGSGHHWASAGHWALGLLTKSKHHPKSPNLLRRAGQA